MFYLVCKLLECLLVLFVKNIVAQVRHWHTCNFLTTDFQVFWLRLRFIWLLLHRCVDVKASADSIFGLWLHRHSWWFVANEETDLLRRIDCRLLCWQVQRFRRNFLHCEKRVGSVLRVNAEKYLVDLIMVWRLDVHCVLTVQDPIGPYLLLARCWLSVLDTQLL